MKIETDLQLPRVNLQGGGADVVMVRPRADYLCRIYRQRGGTGIYGLLALPPPPSHMLVHLADHELFAVARFSYRGAALDMDGVIPPGAPGTGADVRFNLTRFEPGVEARELARLSDDKPFAVATFTCDGAELLNGGRLLPDLIDTCRKCGSVAYSDQLVSGVVTMKCVGCHHKWASSRLWAVALDQTESKC